MILDLLVIGTLRRLHFLHPREALASSASNFFRGRHIDNGLGSFPRGNLEWPHHSEHRRLQPAAAVPPKIGCSEAAASRLANS
jgi:hypothetical protein